MVSEETLAGAEIPGDELEKGAIPNTTVSPPEWSALRRATRRAILMAHSLGRNKVTVRQKENQSGLEPATVCLPSKPVLLVHEGTLYESAVPDNAGCCM